jgi:predicted transcriptional regulator
LKIALEGRFSKVLRFIQGKPGCHLRQIKNELHISMGALQYQLIRLEREGRITSFRHGLYKFYFPYGVFQDNEKEVLRILRRETARDIVILIMERKNPTQTDIVSSIGITSASVNWHVKRLIASGIIEVVKSGKYKRYQLCENHYSSKYIISLLKNYYPNVWSKWSNRLAEMFLSLSRKDNEDENNNNNESK